MERLPTELRLYLLRVTVTTSPSGFLSLILTNKSFYSFYCAHRRRFLHDLAKTVLDGTGLLHYTKCRYLCLMPSTRDMPETDERKLRHAVAKAASRTLLIIKKDEMPEEEELTAMLNTHKLLLDTACLLQRPMVNNAQTAPRISQMHSTRNYPKSTLTEDISAQTALFLEHLYAHFCVNTLLTPDASRLDAFKVNKLLGQVHVSDYAARAGRRLIHRAAEVWMSRTIGEWETGDDMRAAEEAWTIEAKPEEVWEFLTEEDVDKRWDIAVAVLRQSRAWRSSWGGPEDWGW